MKHRFYNIHAYRKAQSLWIGLFVCACAIIPGVTHAERISNFDIKLQIEKNAEVQVNETITYDFEGADRHGIYRDIPTRLSDGAYLGIKNIVVDDGAGHPYQFVTTENGGDVNIRIGNPGQLITGIKTYHLSYLVDNAMVSFTAYDELYWNATGDQWQVPMDHVSVSIGLPSGTKTSDVVQAACYRGSYGSSSSCASAISPQKLLVSESNLGSGEGVTIGIGIRKGIITGIQRIGGQVNTGVGGGFAAPVSSGWDPTFARIFVAGIVALFLISTGAYWFAMRDPKSKNPLVPWYEPPLGLPPVTVGTLVDKTTDMRDITAQIISLASRGYIALTRIEEKELLIFTDIDYKFTVTKDPSDLSFGADTKTLELLFNTTNPKVGTEALMSDLAGKASISQITIEGIRTVVKDYLYTNGFLERNSKSAWSYLVPTVFLVMTYVSFTLGNATHFLSLIIIPVGIICAAIWGGIQQKYTQAGADMKQQLLGFKWFLSVTDKERFDFHNAPEKNPQQFMEYLPYAIAFGVEEKWANQFKDIFIPQPTWYHSNLGTFVALDFVSHMNGFTSSLNTMTTPARSGSGGGGFSGGGGGGGGGGGW